jgi:hypothetical protein
MSSSDPNDTPPKPRPKSNDKEARLAEALRRNLRRRKAAAKPDKTP